MKPDQYGTGSDPAHDGKKMTPNKDHKQHRNPHGEGSFFSRMMQFWIEQKLLMAIGLAGTILLEFAVAPFDWDTYWLPRHPVLVDAIPDIGENQQIGFTAWEGRSPKDIENQITYPLAVSLLEGKWIRASEVTKSVGSVG